MTDIIIFCKADVLFFFLLKMDKSLLRQSGAVEATHGTGCAYSTSRLAHARNTRHFSF